MADLEGYMFWVEGSELHFERPAFMPLEARHLHGEPVLAGDEVEKLEAAFGIAFRRAHHVRLDAERGKAGKVEGIAPFTTPWRVVMVADSPGKLLELIDQIREALLHQDDIGRVDDVPGRLDVTGLRGVRAHGRSLCLV